MKRYIFFLLATSSFFSSFAQQVSVKWRVDISFSEKINSTWKSGGNSTTYDLNMNGTVSMIVEGEPSFDNGHIILKTPQDKLISFTVTGNVEENISSEDRSPVVGVTEIRIDKYHGTADQSEQGIEFEYDPASDGAKYINAGIRYNRIGGYTIDQYHRGSEPDRHLKYESNGDFGTYTASIGSEKDNIQVVKNGFLIDGGSTETDPGPASAGEQHILSKVITYHVSIMKEMDIEAQIVPLNDEQYKKWLPFGAPFADQGEQGNSIAVKIELINKRSPLKAVTNSCTTEWNLKSSVEPGYCMNFPDEKKADRKNDLRFDRSANAMINFQSLTELKATSKKGKGESPITIISYDYGSFGSLTATVTLDDGTVLQAVSKFDNNPVLKIPMDDNNNHMADAWEKEQGIFEKNYAPGWDEDYLPRDLGDHNGDGLTAYEEYRGFCENKKLLRSNVITKDLMVCDMIGERSKDGIALFKDITKINVHDNFQLDEFGRESKDAEVDGMPKDKCINFNYTKESHSVDQHGIALVKSLERKGYAQAVLKIKNGPIGTPKNYKYLEITLDFDPGPKGFNVVNGVINNATSVAGGGGQAKIITDNYARVVAHEMLHCCNVLHHGSGDDSKALLIAGKNLPPTIQIPGGMEVDPEGLYIIIDGKLNTYNDDAKAYYEDETPITSEQLPITGLKLYIAFQCGQHSGFEDCIMRYNAANSYIYKNNHLYLLDAKDGYDFELGGMSICSSGDGTGVNDPQRQPHPRYGRAATDRGNCKHQFCINDKYH